MAAIGRPSQTRANLQQANANIDFSLLKGTSSPRLPGTNPLSMPDKKGRDPHYAAVQEVALGEESLQLVLIPQSPCHNNYHHHQQHQANLPHRRMDDIYSH